MVSTWKIIIFIVREDFCYITGFRHFNLRSNFLFRFRLGYDVGPDGVKIMDGSDEGIFIWYTVNLLHSKFLLNLLFNTLMI